MAENGARPARASSRIRSKISTLASTAIADGEHDAGDAGQGQRRLQQRQHAQHDDEVQDQRQIGDQAEQAVVERHKQDHRHEPR